MLETSSSSVDPGHGAKVLTRALFSVAQRLDLSQLELAKMLATSASTVSRLKQGTLSHGSAEMQLAALLVRIYRSLDSLVGGDDNKAQAWLRADNSHLNGVPAELMTSIPGLVAVAEYLDAMRGKL